jgi:hypothetical protein
MVADNCRLHADFGLHDLLPQAFAQGQAGAQLGIHARGLPVVSFDWPQQANRAVIGTAQHERRAAFGQGHQQVVAVDEAVGVTDQCCNVVDRRTSDFLALVVHDKETAVQ